MALLWADGFDHWGTSGPTVDNTFAVQGGYSSFRGTVQSATVRTSPGRAITFSGSLGSFNRIRRILSAPVDVCGAGIGVRWNAAPVNSSREFHLRFEQSGSSAVFRIMGRADLSIAILNNANTVLGTTDPNTITVNSWLYMEAKAVRNVGGVINTGSIELRVNGGSSVGGQTLIITGVNVPNQFVSVAFTTDDSLGQTGLTLDDFVIWDNSGTRANDFLGERRCYTSFPSANGALQNWVPNAGIAWQNLKNNPAVDTSYVQAANPGDISEFDKTPIGINSNDIAGVAVFARAVKDDAGAATYRIGINSGGVVLNGPEIAPSTSFSGGFKIFESNPNGDIAWTRLAVDAAQIRITREQ